MNLVCEVWGGDDGVELTPVYRDYSIMKVLGGRVANQGEWGVGGLVMLSGGSPCRNPTVVS